MTEPVALRAGAQKNPAGFVVRSLNHVAYRCRDAAETTRFYEGLLGLKLAHVVRADRVPSTGEDRAFAHIFFEMADGSFVAFFDLGDGKPGLADETTPDFVNHLSLEVPSSEDLLAAKARLEAAGVKVNGVVDHDWLHSIYFLDPNGLHLELAWRVKGEETMAEFASVAHEELASWTAMKAGQPA